jgi:signal peptidase I
MMDWLLLLLGACAVLTAGVAGYARRRLIVVVVEGRSMEPTLYEGDRLLVRRCRLRGIRRGDVVILHPPSARLAADGVWRTPVAGRQVKRVAALPGQPVPAGVWSASPVVPADSVVVLSDNAEVGVDSRTWGPYPAGGVLGVVMRRMVA